MVTLGRSPDSTRGTLEPTVLKVAGVLALLAGCWAAWFYHDAGLTLSHYDTKGHLVVARRVFDSLTPGWQQLGALWLPLPHLLNLVPAQFDAFYRTGASAVVISVLAFAAAVYGTARIGLQITGSAAPALAAAALLMLNPDLLYLQATPMTEALLLALMVLAMSFALDWLQEDSSRTRRRTGWAIALLCLTRYEAWPFTAALLVLCAVVLVSSGLTVSDALARLARLAVYPAVAVVAFLVHSRLSVGAWFVTGGFFVVDNLDTGNPFRAVASVWWGTHRIAGTTWLTTAVAGIIVGTFAAVGRLDRRRTLALLAFFAVGALPAYAFFKGHPFRIRYMVPMLPGLAAYAAVLLGALRGRWRQAAAVALVGAVVYQVRPIGQNSPMLLEAQWDTGNAAARRAVVRYLARNYDGRTILASMGSLAHFMQETSAAGIDLADFLHEGNGDLWEAALKDPHPHAGWIAIEEWSEGGDIVAWQSRKNRQFLQGYVRVAEGGGVALYRAGEAGKAGGGGTDRAGKAGGRKPREVKEAEGPEEGGGGR